MRWQEIEKNWKQFERVLKYRWQELTTKDLNQINGNKATLNVKLQGHYQQNKEEANKSINDFLGTFHGILQGKNGVVTKPDTPDMQKNSCQTATTSVSKSN